MNTLLCSKLLKMYLQAKTETGDTVSDTIGKASCHCRKGLLICKSTCKQKMTFPA